MNDRKEDFDQIRKEAAADVILSDPQAFVSHFFKGATVERPLTAAEKYIGEIGVEGRTRQFEIEVILNTLRTCFSAILVEVAKRLDRIQDTEVLEEIKKAALAHDIQRVLALAIANDFIESGSRPTWLIEALK
jgi:hypothetical protein